jgi:hypothetical protein
MIVGDT